MMFFHLIQTLLFFTCTSIGLSYAQNFSIDFSNDGQTTPFMIQVNASIPLQVEFSANTGSADSFIVQPSFFSFGDLVLVNSFVTNSLKIDFNVSIVEFQFQYATSDNTTLEVEAYHQNSLVSTQVFTSSFNVDFEDYEGFSVIQNIGSFDSLIIYGAIAVNFGVGLLTGIESGTSVVGDPIFIGIHGQKFQVHGIDNQVYALISDTFMQFNSRFSFLDHGECTDFLKSIGSMCWSHPGSYITEIGLISAYNETLVIRSGPASSGFLGVEQSNPRRTRTIRLHDLSSHQVTFSCGEWKITVVNSDGFLNIVKAITLSHQVSGHGLIAQTDRSSIQHPVEGEIDDYAVNSNILLNHDFVYNRFHLVE